MNNPLKRNYQLSAKIFFYELLILVWIRSDIVHLKSSLNLVMRIFILHQGKLG